MFSLSLLFAFFIIAYFNYWLKRRLYWQKKNTKSVSGLLWRFLTGNRSLSEHLKEVYDKNPNQSQIGLFIGTRPALIIRDLKNVRAVLHGDCQRFFARGLVTKTTEVLADNLLFAEDYNRWKLLRHKASIMFATKYLKNMFESINKCAKDFIVIAEKNPKIFGNPFQAVYTYVTGCISTATFDIDEETRKNMKISFEEMASTPLKPSLKLSFKYAIVSISKTLFDFLGLKIFGKYETFWVTFINDLLEKHKNRGKINSDYIDSLLRLQDQGVIKDYVTDYETNVTKELLAAQAFVYVLGGIDSSANTIHFTLLELSNNPIILKKLHHEIDTLFESNNGTLMFEDMDKLEYLDKVINEAMRKYPPVGTLQRICCKDTVLPAGQLKVEKDTIVFIPVYALHRDEHHFPNPERFDPERFSAENVSKIPKYSYLPWGEGIRNCIGIRLAQMEVKVGLAWILRKYTLEEQSYTPDHFEPSFFSLRDPKSFYRIIPRSIQ